MTEPDETEASGPDATAPGAVPVPGERPSGDRKAPSGRSQAFRDLRRELTEEELRSSGASKLLLDKLEQLEADTERLGGYVDRFHDVDRQLGILQEQLKTNRVVEATQGFGAVILGLAPFVWSESKSVLIGLLAAGIGLALMLVAFLGRRGRL